MKKSCSKIFDDINKLVRAGKIKIKDKHVPIEIFVGGDYKVILKCTVEFMPRYSVRVTCCVHNIKTHISFLVFVVNTWF